MMMASFILITERDDPGMVRRERKDDFLSTRNITTGYPGRRR
jgi:hypothetical protein